MRLFLHLRRVVVVGAAGILLAATVVGPGTGAAASTTDASPVAAYLAAHPGGQPLNDNEISYGGGAFIVTLNPPPGSVQGVPDCPWGWFCFYDRPAFGYPRGKLSSCGWQYLGAWGWQFRTESAYYALDRGDVLFHYYEVYLFRVGADSRSLMDTAPNRNVANWVQRRC